MNIVTSTILSAALLYQTSFPSYPTLQNTQIGSNNVPISQDTLLNNTCHNDGKIFAFRPEDINVENTLQRFFSGIDLFSIVSDDIDISNLSKFSGELAIIRMENGQPVVSDYILQLTDDLIIQAADPSVFLGIPTELTQQNQIFAMRIVFKIQIGGNQIANELIIETSPRTSDHPLFTFIDPITNSMRQMQASIDSSSQEVVYAMGSGNQSFNFAEILGFGNTYCITLPETT